MCVVDLNCCFQDVLITLALILPWCGRTIAELHLIILFWLDTGKREIKKLTEISGKIPRKTESLRQSDKV